MAFKIPNFYSKSPLHGSYYNPKGETYISEVGMIQDAANAVSKAAMDIDNASAESKAKRQGKRLDRMKKRKTTTGRTKRIEKVQKKYETNVEQAGKDEITKNENAFNKWLNDNTTASQAVIDAKKAELGITT